MRSCEKLQKVLCGLLKAGVLCLKLFSCPEIWQGSFEAVLPSIVNLPDIFEKNMDIFTCIAVKACGLSKILTHKQLEINGFVLSTVATDALVLKHQGISIHSADQISIPRDQF